MIIFCNIFYWKNIYIKITAPEIILITGNILYTKKKYFGLMIMKMVGRKYEKKANKPIHLLKYNEHINIEKPK